MKPRTPPLRGEPTIPCPACGAAIPIAEAVERAVTERTALVQQAATSAQTHWAQQEKALKAETDKRLREQEKQLANEHARALHVAQAKAERSHQGLLKRLQEKIELKEVQQKEDLQFFQHKLKAAERAARQSLAAGREEGRAELSKAQEMVLKAQAEQHRMKQELTTASTKLVNATVESRAAFERGRKKALETSDVQLKELQKLVDETRSHTVKREKEFSIRLSAEIREAEQRAATAESLRHKAEMERALKAERERLGAETDQEHAVERQRFENQLQKMRGEIETLHRKAENAPSEATGQAGEDVLERRLKDAFRSEGDTISRSKKGQRGADFLITVPRAGFRKLLLECKWTQSFDQGWVAKAQADRAAVGAEVAIIVSRSLPAGVEHLSLMEDVWVTSHDTVLALVMALRHGLLALERAGRAASLDEAQVQHLKKYLTGPQFRQQVELIVRLAAEQSEGLTKERTQHERAWTQTKDAQDKILASAVAIWTNLELHSGSSLQPSEILKPYLAPAESEDHAKPKRRGKAA